MPEAAGPSVWAEQAVESGDQIEAYTRRFEVDGRRFGYVSLADAVGRERLSRLPVCRRILIENLLRTRGPDAADQIQAVLDRGSAPRQILFDPARVLTTDFSGLPTVLDLTAIQHAITAMGRPSGALRLTKPLDLVVDHSISLDVTGTCDALERNVAFEHQRNGERYRFLKWAQTTFPGLRIVPPGKGICHQINIEHLATVVGVAEDGGGLAYPDTVVGTDSHTTMANGLGVLAWGVGGIEATAALLGEPIPLLSPRVVGMELTGKLPPGVLATDLVLTLTERLRADGVVSDFVEFFGDGLDALSAPDRATIANMAPEYGATCGYFPIDEQTLAYLVETGREAGQVALVEHYARLQGLWRPAQPDAIAYDRRLHLDLSTVVPVVAGPARPNQRTPLSALPQCMGEAFPNIRPRRPGAVSDGDVVIAAITSCTNTANPKAMIAAGLLAAKARALGMRPAPHIKASLAPGSQTVADYLARAGLMSGLEHFGFFLAGVGCTTCIGNSGPLPAPIAQQIEADDLVVAAVLSGNRNFEGRIANDVRANFLASPALVVAFAIAGSVLRDLAHQPLGEGSDGRPVFLSEVWPGSDEIDQVLRAATSPVLFRDRRDELFMGGPAWSAIATPAGAYDWDPASTYIRRPPFVEDIAPAPSQPQDILGARILALLGDSITTDLIAPAGAIRLGSPAAQWLRERGVGPTDLHSYGARRGAHEVVARGAFANPRLRNEMVQREGGWTRHWPSGDETTIWEAAERYRAEHQPMVLIGGREYGTGSSRDQAARGVRLLGVRAVIAESFERIHRSNLIGLGILPLQFEAGVDWHTLALTGSETVDIVGFSTLAVGQSLACRAAKPSGEHIGFQAICRIDTDLELEYFRHDGLLPYLARRVSA
jgi:aconitate hydratase